MPNTNQPCSQVLPDVYRIRWLTQRCIISEIHARALASHVWKEARQ